jgi:hypothetical protein
MTTPAAPKANAVSYEAVATVARERVLALTEEGLLKDAQLREMQQYIEHLEARLNDAGAAPGPQTKDRPAT